MSKLVVFCDNYTQAFNTLRLISDDRYEEKTIVVTQYENYYKFFQSINERVFHGGIKVIFPGTFQPEMARASGINKAWYTLKDIVNQRRYLKELYYKYFAKLEGEEIIFGPGYTGIQCYLLKKLAGRNQVIYYSPIPGSRITAYTPRSISQWLTLIIYKVTWGWDMGMGQTPNVSYISKGWPYLPDKVIAKASSRIVDWKEAAELMNSLDLDRFRVFDTGTYKIIYFHDDFIEAPYSSIDEDAANTVFSRVFEVMVKHFPETEIASKFTPGNPPKPRLQIGGILPAFVPAELYYKDSIKMYLSVASGAITNVEKGLAVSLLNLMPFRDEKIREDARKAVLERQKSNIVFPGTIEEFEQIVVKLK